MKLEDRETVIKELKKSLKIKVKIGKAQDQGGQDVLWGTGQHGVLVLRTEKGWGLMGEVAPVTCGSPCGPVGSFLSHGLSHVPGTLGRM